MPAPSGVASTNAPRGVGLWLPASGTGVGLLPPVSRGRTLHLGALNQNYALGKMRSWDSMAPESTDSMRYSAQWVLGQRPSLSSLNNYPAPSCSRAASQFMQQTDSNGTEGRGTWANLITSTSRTIMHTGIVPTMSGENNYGLFGCSGASLAAFFEASGGFIYIQAYQDGGFLVQLPAAAMGKPYVYIERHDGVTLDFTLWVYSVGTYQSSASRGAISNSLNLPYQLGCVADGASCFDGPIASFTTHIVPMTNTERDASLAWGQGYVSGNPPAIGSYATHPVALDPLALTDGQTIALGPTSFTDTAGTLTAITNLVSGGAALQPVGAPSLSTAINGLRGILCAAGKYISPVSATLIDVLDPAGGPWALLYTQMINTIGPAYSGNDCAFGTFMGMNGGGRYLSGASPPERYLAFMGVSSPQAIAFSTGTGVAWQTNVPHVGWDLFDGTRIISQCNGAKASQDCGGGHMRTPLTGTFRIGGRPPPVAVDRIGPIARLYLWRPGSSGTLAATIAQLERMAYSLNVEAGLA